MAAGGDRGSGTSPRVAESGGSYYYRSPWPMLLRDGRIVALFGRRRPPYGIGLVVSGDRGKTWSDELVLRTKVLRGISATRSSRSSTTVAYSRAYYFN